MSMIGHEMETNLLLCVRLLPSVFVKLNQSSDVDNKGGDNPSRIVGASFFKRGSTSRGSPLPVPVMMLNLLPSSTSQSC